MSDPMTPPVEKERAAMRHELKTWPEYFKVTWDRKKPFEVRLNDRDYQVGDTLHLYEWTPGNGGKRSGRFVDLKVISLYGPGELIPLADGFCIMGLQEVGRSIMGPQYIEPTPPASRTELSKGEQSAEELVRTIRRGELCTEWGPRFNISEQQATALIEADRQAVREECATQAEAHLPALIDAAIKQGREEGEEQTRALREHLRWALSHVEELVPEWENHYDEDYADGRLCKPAENALNRLAEARAALSLPSTVEERSLELQLLDWHRSVYPEDDDVMVPHVFAKAEEEIEEFLREPSVEEAADVVLCLTVWAERQGQSMEQAIRAKLAVLQSPERNQRERDKARGIHVGAFSPTNGRTP